MAADGQMNTKKAILEALEAKHGIVTEACKSIGLSRSTYYDWLNTDPVFKLAVEDITETAIDYVEGKLYEKITGVMVSGGIDEDGEAKVYQQPPSDTAIIFFLKTKAKKRGYVEKTEMGFTNAAGEDQQPVIILPSNNRDPQIETK